MRTHKAAALTFIACLYSTSLWAGAREDLQQTNKDLEASKEHRAELAEETHKLEIELKKLQEQMVETVAKVQKSEAELSAVEQKLSGLDEQIKVKSDSIKSQRNELSGLVQAALKLSRTPPEAMVMMPGDTEQVMKASRALRMASDAIRQRTSAIGRQIAEMEQLRDEATTSREVLKQDQEVYAREKDTLKGQLDERKSIRAKLGRETRDTDEEIGQLAKRAEDLQDLITSLSREEKQSKVGHEVKPDLSKPEGTHGRVRSFTAAKGHIRAPVAGQVQQAFGMAENKNDTSKGVVIVARRGAQVTSPYDGEVVFTGPFLNYGKLVIIKHSDEFHTLLAGLGKINIKVGDFLLEGEPIGAMGDNESGNRLYVELRKNNQPVDPAPWINGLNKKNQE